MSKAETECCGNCGSCGNVAPGVYYYGKQLSMRERTEGSCCRTRRITTAYEILGRGSELICGRCVLLRRIRHGLWILPVVGLAAFALAWPAAIPDHGPLRLAFFSLMALSLFPAWIQGRRVLYRADRLRDEVASARARRKLRGTADYQRENQGVVRGGPGGEEVWTSTTPMRDYVFFTRSRYRRMGGTDQGIPS